MSDDRNRETIERALAAFEAGDLDVYESLLAEDAVEEWPQSGELLRGRDNIMAVNRNYPGFPKVKGREIRGSGDLWVAEADLDYGGRPVHWCSIFEFRDGKIVRETDYFADPFDPPTWRARWVERLPRKPPPPAARF